MALRTIEFDNQKVNLLWQEENLIKTDAAN